MKFLTTFNTEKLGKLKNWNKYEGFFFWKYNASKVVEVATGIQ